MTLESGLGHRTVPLLLAESSFSGSAKNWSSLLQLKANMTLEVTGLVLGELGMKVVCFPMIVFNRLSVEAVFSSCPKKSQGPSTCDTQRQSRVLGQNQAYDFGDACCR